MASVLLAQPLALAAFLLAVALVVIGGSMLMFLVKGGTVTVLVAAERAAGAIEHPPLRLPAFHRATQFSLERFTGGASRLFPRYLTLGVWLMLIYLLSTLVVAGAGLRSPEPTGDWRLRRGRRRRSSSSRWITVVNFFYLLLQIVIAADDCTVREAVGRVAPAAPHPSSAP